MNQLTPKQSKRYKRAIRTIGIVKTQNAICHGTWGKCFKRENAPVKNWTPWIDRYGLETVRYAIRKMKKHEEEHGRISHALHHGYLESTLNGIEAKRDAKREKRLSRAGTLTLESLSQYASKTGRYQ